MNFLEIAIFDKHLFLLRIYNKCSTNESTNKILREQINSIIHTILHKLKTIESLQLLLSFLHEAKLVLYKPFISDIL